MQRYHDKEWGVPEHRDQKLYEFLLLEGAQAGLSWELILKRREGYRKAFAGFDPRKVARFTDRDVSRLLKDTTIIRNRLKIRSAITNACLLLEIQKEHGSFDNYVWAFVGGKQRASKRTSFKNLPTHSKESDAMAKALKKRGFSFVGTTTCYSFMQATGMVNDHLISCFRYKEVSK